MIYQPTNASYQPTLFAHPSMSPACMPFRKRNIPLAHYQRCALAPIASLIKSAQDLSARPLLVVPLYPLTISIQITIPVHISSPSYPHHCLDAQTTHYVATLFLNVVPPYSLRSHARAFNGDHLFRGITSSHSLDRSSAQSFHYSYSAYRLLFVFKPVLWTSHVAMSTKLEPRLPDPTQRNYTSCVFCRRAL